MEQLESGVVVQNGSNSRTRGRQNATGVRRLSKKAIAGLLAGVLLAFGVLVVFVRMPRMFQNEPESLPLTLTNSNRVTRDNKVARISSKGPLAQTDGICKTSACLKTAYTLLDSMNTSVNPCDDFFEYACGNWIAKNPIPPQVSKWSHFGKLDFQTSMLIREILSESPKPQDPASLKQAKDFYQSCSNVDALDKVGLVPVLRFLEDYGGWPLLTKPGTWNALKFDWMRSLAELKRFFGTSAILDFVINQNVLTPNYSTIHLQQPSLFLSRPYLLEQKKYPSYVRAYKKFIVDIAKELKTSEGIKAFEKGAGTPSSLINSTYLEQQAEDLIAFETLIANLTKDGVAVQYGLRNATATVTLKFLQSIFTNYTFSNSTNRLDMKRVLELMFQTTGIRITDGQLVSMSDVNYVGSIFELLAGTPTETLANYLHFRMLGWVVSGTTKEMREHVNQYHQKIYGLKGSSTREYVCGASTEEKFGLALSKEYLTRTQKAQHVSTEQTIQKVSGIMEEVRKTFITLLDSATWMNKGVRDGLKDKAKSIASCIGFPSWMSPVGNQRDHDTYLKKLKTHYQGLDVGNGSYLQKLWNVRRWQTDSKLKLLKEPFIPGCKWTSFPGQIGAFYDIRRKAVNIPLGVIQAPFFFKDSPASVNYGGIGSVLGHEFTHGFTVNGWTEDDNGTFTPLSQCFVDQYSKFKLGKEMVSINGALTFDENFPDNGGLFEAYQTYKTFASSQQSQESLPGLEHLSHDQLFFLGFSNIWCSASRPMGLLDQILMDHHTPNKYRVLGSLQNSREFAQAWNCPAGSRMNPSNQKKCNAFQ